MIDIELEGKDYYRLQIISSPDWEKDQRRVSDLPERKGVWSTEGGVDIFEHWLIPRVDVGEIRRRWKSEEITADAAFWKDVKTWRRVGARIDPAKSFKGKIDTGKIKKLYRRQELYARIDPARRRTLCDWGTGKGKTIAGLARARMFGHKKTIIVTTSSVFDDWVRDAEHVFGVRVTAYMGKTKRQREKLREDLADIVVCTYDNAFELPVDWEHYIFDEGDMVSNPDTLRYSRMIPLFNATWKGRRAVQVLTATMIGNTPSTAWSTWNLIHPLLAGSRTAFRLRYEKYLEMEEKSYPVKRGGRVIWMKKKQAKSIEFQNQKRFVEKMAAFAIQLPAEDLEVPYEEKTFYVPVNMTRQQKEIYDKLKAELKVLIGRRRINIKQALLTTLRLQQVAEGLFHFDDDKRFLKESGKLRYLYRLLSRRLKAGDDRKVIVWSRYVKLPEILYRLFKRHAVFYSGKLNHEQKRLAKWSFNGVRSEKERRLFYKFRDKYGGHHEPGGAWWLFGVMAGSTGRGMSLQACGEQFVTSISFSAPVLTQNLGRLGRADTKHKILKTHHLQAEGSGDAHWLRCVSKKQAYNIKMTVGGLERLKMDQVRELVSGA